MSELANLNLTDPDCILAMKQLSDQDLYTSVVDIGSYKVNVNHLDPSGECGNFDLDCNKIMPLKFSMATFPHLQVLSQPWNISWTEEGDIDVPLTKDQIYSGLMKNKTSWYLYNLASLHWRKVGNGQKALDCIKRAIHFASREYKAAPLLNLGVMLQRANCTAEAAVLLQSSIDHAPYKPLGHFALANVYAILGDYNSSIARYDNVLEINPDWKLVKRIKRAVLCQRKLHDSLFKLHRFQQDVSCQLREYRSLLDKWLKNLEELIEHQAPSHTSFASTLSDSCIDLGADNNFSTCQLPNKAFDLMNHQLHLGITLWLQFLVNLDSQFREITEQLTWRLHEPRVGNLKDRRIESNKDENIEVVIEESEEIQKSIDLNL